MNVREFGKLRARKRDHNGFYGLAVVVLNSQNDKVSDDVVQPEER